MCGSARPCPHVITLIEFDRTDCCREAPLVDPSRSARSTVPSRFGLPQSESVSVFCGLRDVRRNLKMREVLSDAIAPAALQSRSSQAMQSGRGPALRLPPCRLLPGTSVRVKGAFPNPVPPGHHRHLPTFHLDPASSAAFSTSFHFRRRSIRATMSRSSNRSSFWSHRRSSRGHKFRGGNRKPLQLED